MKRFMKVLLAAWLTGAVMGGGCFCGAVASGMLVPKNSAADANYEFVQAQIEEMQATIEALAYQPIDEFAGLGEKEWAK